MNSETWPHFDYYELSSTYMINSVLILVYIDHFVRRVFMKHPHTYVPARRSEMDFFGTSCWDSKLHFSLDQTNTEINYITN